MSQKTGIFIFLTAAIITAMLLFYAVFVEHSTEDVYFNLLETEESEDLKKTQSLEEKKKQQDKKLLDNQDNMQKEQKKEIDNDSHLENTKEIENIKEMTAEKTICAFVCGKVKNVGIYELFEGARLSDFISAAGGFSKQAAKEYLNLAQKAEDGQRIYIPSKKEAKRWKQKEENDKIESESSRKYLDEKLSKNVYSEKEKININTAKKEELMTLSGIGASKAEAILSYREEKGEFHTIEELMQIPGIKEGIYNKLCNDITI